MLQSQPFSSHTRETTSQSLRKSVPAQPQEHNNAADKKTTLVSVAACKSSYPKGRISCSKDPVDVSGWLIVSSG